MAFSRDHYVFAIIITDVYYISASRLKCCIKESRRRELKCFCFNNGIGVGGWKEEKEQQRVWDGGQAPAKHTNKKKTTFFIRREIRLKKNTVNCSDCDTIKYNHPLTQPSNYERNASLVVRRIKKLKKLIRL